MVTTNCLELTGEGTCKIPLTGNSLDELKNNVFAHAQQHHADKLTSITPQEQQKMVQRIEQVYRQKSGATAAH